MKNVATYRHALVLLAGACLSLAVDTAIAVDTNRYVGAGNSGVAADYNVADFDDGSISQDRVDDNDTVWKLFSSYRLANRR